MSERTLYLVDTYAQIFRSFFAIRTDMRSAITGEPTQAAFAMTGFLLKLLGKFQPDYVVAVVDAPGPTFRDALHDTYKGTRAEMPADLRVQIPRILSLIDAMGIHRIEQSGLEADDIIAAITRHVLADTSARDVRIRIASKDKDLLQLLGPRVTLFDIQSEAETDVAALRAARGIAPEQVVDYLTLTGDTVDNVPGVPGVGPKTAAQLLTAYGTLDGIYENLHLLPARLREKMEAAREQTARSRVLVTLRDDDALGFVLPDARPRGIDLDATLELFRQFDFHRFADEVRRLPLRDALTERLAATDYDPFAEDAAAMGSPAPLELAEAVPALVRRVQDVEAVQELCDEIRRDLTGKPGASPDVSADLLAVTVETASDGALIAVAFAWGDGERGGVVVSFADRSDDARAVLWKSLGPLLGDDTIAKVVHDGKALTRALLRDGAAASVVVQGVVFDTQLAAQVDGQSSAEIGHLASLLLPAGLPTFDGPCAERAVEHAVAALRLAAPLRASVEAKTMLGLLDEIERPLAPILAQMEHAGILCNADELLRQREALTVRVGELKQAVYEAAGFTFDLNSPQQLGVALFERLGLPPGKRTKTGYSTDKDVLETLAQNEEADTPHTAVPRLILEYRQLTKLLSTYLGNLRDAISPDGRIHTTFRQLATATGRLASDGPNLQNIPVRSELGRNIRRAFHAPPGGVLICADYSQIELRLLAHLSGDAAMIDAFAQGIDIHTSVAMQVFGIETPEAVSREQRSQAKTINFGIVYGISPFGLARRIRALDRETATTLIAQYRARYAGIDRFLQECIERAKSDGFVTTMAGRRRPIPEIRARGTMALGERLAINTVVQGSAADLIKRAMVRVQNRLDREKIPARMLLQIHDELVFEFPSGGDAARDAAELIRAEMEAAMTLRVPLVATYGMGTNWADAK